MQEPAKAGTLRRESRQWACAWVKSCVEGGASPEKLAPGESFLMLAHRGARPYLACVSARPGSIDWLWVSSASALATLLARANDPRANVRV